MADSTISVTPATGGGQDPTTQNNLQASGETTLNNGLGGKVQPGIAADQLKSDQGISLNPTALSTVDLSTAATGTTATVQAEPAKHAFNPMLLGISIALFIIAVVMFYITSQSGKKHNQYK